MKMEQAAGESPKRKNMAFTTQRKFEIKKDYKLYIGFRNCYMFLCLDAIYREPQIKSSTSTSTSLIEEFLKLMYSL
jgi:hypothetical protein